MTHRLLEFCRAEEPWLLDLTERLVRLESPSGDAAAIGRCTGALSAALTDAGGRVKGILASGGDHLRAEFGQGDRQVLFLGHVDTVWPVGQLTTMPLRREGDRLYGPGIFDMKAGLALAVLAARAFAGTPAASRLKVVMLWTTDEEVGSRTSRALIETEALHSHAVLVFEPSLPGGGLKTSRKGVGQFTLDVTGEPAHAGVDPGKGVSAIRELARQILAVETLQDVDRGLTVNVGLVTGGTRANVVAAHAQAVVDVRASTMTDAAGFDAAIHRLTPHLPGARLTVSGGFSRPPLERTARSGALFALAADVACELGQTLTEGSTGGGSDGNFCGALGIPVLDGLGAVGDGAHALHEHVLVSSLAPRAALVAGLLTRLTTD